MTRKRDVDWSDWKGHVEKPVSPLSRELPSSLKKGADIFKDVEVASGNLPVLMDAPKQPTKAQFDAKVAEMLPTKEQMQKAEYEWENRFNIHLNAWNMKVDHLNKSEKSDRAWGTGKSFNSMLTEEERRERQMHAKD